MILDVTQTELENGYYFVDLPALLAAKRKHEAVNRMSDILTLIATGNRGMEESEYKKFIAELNREIGIKATNKFDRGKFDELRTMTEMGSNLTI